MILWKNLKTINLIVILKITKITYRNTKYHTSRSSFLFYLKAFGCTNILLQSKYLLKFNWYLGELFINSRRENNVPLKWQSEYSDGS